MLAPIEEARLGTLAPAVDRALSDIASITDIQAHVADWIRVIAQTRSQLPKLRQTATDLSEAGFTDVLLLGIGGASLPPKVYGHSPLARKTSALSLSVCNTTHPDVITALSRQLVPERTIVIVSTKSGTTVETISAFKFFYNWMAEALGEPEGARHFVAVTTTGSKLALLAEQLRLRGIFLDDENKGGRHSELSIAGILPATLCGLDVDTILDRAELLTRRCQSGVVSGNPAAWLGTALGVMEQHGRDKLTIIAPHSLGWFTDWMEQKIAERVGKDGHSLVVLGREMLAGAETYGEDRVFVELDLVDSQFSDSDRQQLDMLAQDGHPVLRVKLSGLSDVGAQFVLWGTMTVGAAAQMGTDPFVQPDMVASRRYAAEIVAGNLKAVQGIRPPTETNRQNTGVKAAPVALHGFLTSSKPGGYISLQVWLPRDDLLEAEVQRLRRLLHQRYRLPVTVDYGPEYIHGTGQQHKGDSGRGSFVQLHGVPVNDVPIPDIAGRPESSITFGALHAAQALGDQRALEEKGRAVLSLQLGPDPVAALRALAEDLS